jgi:hypothetical protein
MSGPAASNPLNICGAMVVTCIRNALKRQIQNLLRACPTQLHCVKTGSINSHRHRSQSSAQQHLPQEEIQRTGLSVQAPSSSKGVRTSTASRQAAPTATGTAVSPPRSSIYHKRNFRGQVCQYRLPVRLRASAHQLRQDKHQDMRQKTQSCFIRDSNSSPLTEVARVCVLSHLL